MTRVAIAALLMALLSVTSSAQADGHSALEQENEELKQTVATLTADRDRLSNRLRRAIANAKSKRGELASATEERDVLRDRLRRAIAHSKSKRGELASATKDRDFLRDRLRRAIANAKSTKSELEGQITATGTGQAEWASDLSRSLQSSIGGIQGTKVSTGSDNSVRVQVGNTGLFATGGVALSDNGEAMLSQIAQQLQLTEQGTSITVVGHSDNVPVGSGSRFDSNEALSFARATSTLQFLRNEGVSVERLSAAGYGSDYPIASNDTADGRRQNRRVDIVLRSR